MRHTMGRLNILRRFFDKCLFHEQVFNGRVLTDSMRLLAFFNFVPYLMYLLTLTSNNLFFFLQRLSYIIIDEIRFYILF